MSAVSEVMVREYFELHGFLVRQLRKHVAPSQREEEEIDFLVVNPQARTSATGLPFVLKSADLPSVARAIVAVKGWHTETFSPAVLARAPEIFRFVEQTSFEQAARALGAGGPPPSRILVVPALPQHEAARSESIEVLRTKGIDAVLPFRTLLADLVNHVEVNRNYQKSDLLQTIRILKNYDFFKEPQMELFRVRRRRSRATRKPKQTESASAASPEIS